MSTTLQTLSLPLARPTFAAADHLLAILRKAGLALWRFLEHVGRARAARELAVLADSFESSNPELAAQIRRGLQT